MTMLKLRMRMNVCDLDHPVARGIPIYVDGKLWLGQLVLVDEMGIEHEMDIDFMAAPSEDELYV